jgi:hypothetical protein
MDQAIHELLEAVDDSINTEHPPEFEWDILSARVELLKPELERIAGRPFDLDHEVQDASFFGDLGVYRLTEQEAPLGRRERGRVLEAVFAVRFSNFGALFTTWSVCRTERLSDGLITELVRAVSLAGFLYVPTEALDEAYTGPNPAFDGATWWERYFDYFDPRYGGCTR